MKPVGNPRYNIYLIPCWAEEREAVRVYGMKDIAVVTFVSLISSLFLVLIFRAFPPANLERHVPHGSNEVLERNYDGPLYVVLAQTLYDPNQLEALNFHGLGADYYPSHFPLYPLLIRLVSLFIGDYFRAMILVNWLSSAAAAVAFCFILKEKKIRGALWLSLAFLFLPPRWLAVRSVGASEGVFVLFLLLATWFWMRKHYFFSGIMGALLVLARPPGILFFPAFVLIAIVEKVHIRRSWPILLMPASLLLLFYFYALRIGDFFILLHNTSGTSTLLGLVPFDSMRGYVGPVGEGLIYLYGLYAAGFTLLWRQKEKMLVFLCSFYFLSTLFVKIDDVWRELIPISGFVLVYAFRKIILTRYAFYFLLPYLFAVYLYTSDLLPRRMFHYWDYANLRIRGETITSQPSHTP